MVWFGPGESDRSLRLLVFRPNAVRGRCPLFLGLNVDGNHTVDPDPGIALAEEVTARQKGNQVLFVGTARGLEVRAVPRAGFPLELIDATGVKGRGPSGWIAGCLRVPRAVLQSIRILRRFAPDVVVGVGGYASFPVVLAAWLMRIPTAVQEQNAMPGLTNRLLSRLAGTVFVAFDEARARAIRVTSRRTSHPAGRYHPNRG